MIVAGLVVNVLGLVFLFVGNLFVTDALGKWGAHKLPGYKWGNRLQGVGFVLSLVGVFIGAAA